jgi:hypothetical protein
MKTRVLVATIMMGALCACATPHGSRSIASLRSQLDHFQYRGKAVSPYILKALLPFSSDSGRPTLIAVDLSTSIASNQFAGDFSVDKAGFTTTKPDRTSGEVFAYRWEGETSKGIQVVSVRDSSTDGTGVFYSLFLFDFTSKRISDGTGAAYQQDILSTNKIISLGDRVSYAVKVRGDSIDVTTQSGQGDESKVTYTANR